MIKKPVKKWQWLTTAPSPAAKPGSDPRGWRTHAVDANDEMSFEELNRQRAVCGLAPAHGWDIDLYIDRKCARCAAMTGE